MEFRNDIQGLRALAVLFVFIFHLNPNWLPGGFIGVDVFFVISGYLISGIILHKKEKKTFSFIDFYIGRIKRIVPVFLIFLIVVMAIGIGIYQSMDIQSLKTNTFWTTIFNSNYHFARLDNYFGATSSENPLLHTWTLAIEMKFYFLLPILLVLTNKKHLKFSLLFIICILITYSYYNSTFLGNRGLMYFSLLARIPEFLIGTFFFINREYIKKKFTGLGNLISIISLIILTICSFAFNENTNFPGLLVLIPCVATGCLLILEDSLLSKKLLSYRVLVYIGALSYSIYLWHWAIMAYIRYYKYEYYFNILEIIFITLLTLLLSYLSYTFIENYFRKLNNKRFALLFSIPVLIFCGLLYFIKPLNSNFLFVPSKFSEPTFGLNSHGIAYKEADFLGDTNKTNDSILLIGDSHALVNKKIFDVVGKKNGFNFYAISNNVYPVYPGINKSDFPDENNYNIYLKLVKEVYSYIDKSKTIIISSSFSKKIPSASEALINFIIETDNNKKIILLNDFPVLDRNPIRINKSFKRNNKYEKRNDYQILYNSIPSHIVETTKDFENFHILNINFEKYKNDIPFNNDTIMYYDSSHLNEYGSEVFGEWISEELTNKLRVILNK